MVLVARWLWASGAPGARLARLALVPLSLVYCGAMVARARAYASGALRSRPLGLPAVAVGNLTVGGSGKTPLAAWIARYYADRGLRPAILLRGYGGDEGDVHRRLLPEAVVVEDADRLRGARAAAEAGAHVVVLDDAYQRLDVRRDLDVLVVSAESQRAARWTLPAGPWREGWQALGRAGLVAVTRKRAPLVAARAVAQRVAERAPRAHVAIARLGLSGLRGLVTSNSHDASNLADATVLAAAGVGDPESFAEQLRLLGASVRSIRWRDHQPVTEREIARLLEAGATVDYVVVTEKDAAKLRPLWPPDAPEPLVAGLRVVWESGRRAFEGALDAVVSGATEPGRELRRRP